MNLETLTLEAGERGEIVLYPEEDTRDPLVVVEGSDKFVAEDVLCENLPAPDVEVLAAAENTWRARVRGVLACPERPIKILVRNTSPCKITLRASVASPGEED